MILDFHEPVSACSHGLWAILTIPSWALLVKDSNRKLTLSIFMATTLLCYTSSFLYHAVAPIWVETFRICDHVCIFLLIAGTYTPIAYQYCKSIKSIIFIWGLALTGIVLYLLNGIINEFVYIAIAWAMILSGVELTKCIFSRDGILIVLGGLCYTTGGALEYFRVPNIIQYWLGHHEVFHLFVMSGTSLHYAFMWRELRGIKSGGPKIYNKV